MLLEQLASRPKKVSTFPYERNQVESQDDDKSMKVYSVTSSLQITEYARMKSSDRPGIVGYITKSPERADSIQDKTSSI